MGFWMGQRMFFLDGTENVLNGPQKDLHISSNSKNIHAAFSVLSNRASNLIPYKAVFKVIGK